MNEKVYMHSINNSRRYFNAKESRKVLKQVLDDGALLSLRLQGKDYPIGFNGLDYISLCDFERRFIVHEGTTSYNAFYGYIRYGLALAFRKEEINAIVPELISICTGKNRHFYMKELGLSEYRCSDLPDEVQVKDKVSLNHLDYLTFPVDEYFDNRLLLSTNSRRNALIKEIEELKRLLQDYNIEKNIYDISSHIMLDSEGIDRLLLTKSK